VTGNRLSLVLIKEVLKMADLWGVEEEGQMMAHDKREEVEVIVTFQN
jgi:hypothetical protein